MCFSLSLFFKPDGTESDRGEPGVDSLASSASTESVATEAAVKKMREDEEERVWCRQPFICYKVCFTETYTVSFA